MSPAYNPSFSAFFQQKQYFSLTTNQSTVFFSRLISPTERGQCLVCMTDNNLHKSCTASLLLLVIKKDDDPNPARLMDGRHASWRVAARCTPRVVLLPWHDQESKRARRARPGLGALTVSLVGWPVNVMTGLMA
jgi:hypothetical protein